MRTLLLFSLLLTCFSPGHVAGGAQEDSLVLVLDFKYFKTRQTIKQVNSSTTVAPAPNMVEAKNIALRNPRPQGRVGAPDPNSQTIDARSAALEKNVQESLSPSTNHVDGYTYQTKIRNAHTQTIEIVYWEYQFKELANPSNVIRRQFLCGAKIKPGKERELLAFSVLGTGDVISIDSLTKKSGNLFEEKVVINRVEYADGAILQRRDWNFAEMKSSIERVTSTPWGTEMCRSL